MTGLAAYTATVGLYVLVWLLAVVSGIAALAAALVWVARRLTVGVRSRRARPG